MRKEFFILIPCILIFFQCSEKTLNNKEINTVKVQIGRNDEASAINNFIKLSHFIPLETTDSCMIGKISKLQIINNKIYILDEKQATVFAFNMEGDLLFSLCKKGRAHNEYIHASDFEVQQDGSIFIYDALMGKIYVYDESGGLLDHIDSRIKGWSFKLLENDLIAYNLGNGMGDGKGNYILYNYVCASNDTVIRKDIPFHNVLLGHKISAGIYNVSLFSQYDEKIYMSSYLNDTIYEVSPSNGELYPYMAFDFKADRPQTDDPEKYAASYIGSIINGEVPSTPSSFYNFKNGVMALYSYGRKTYIIIASSSGEILYSTRTPPDENGISLSYITPYLDSDNTGYILNIATPTNIRSWIHFLNKNEGKKSPVLEKMNAQTQEEGNPVLIFYKWIYE